LRVDTASLCLNLSAEGPKLSNVSYFVADIKTLTRHQ